jgi:hypothetical protein
MQNSFYRAVPHGERRLLLDLGRRLQQEAKIQHYNNASTASRHLLQLRSFSTRRVSWRIFGKQEVIQFLPVRWRLFCAGERALLRWHAPSIGNERTRIQLPELQVPLATYTGWNLRAADMGMPGYTVPFVGHSSHLMPMWIGMTDHHHFVTQTALRGESS